ncbi:hybrid sensor histidine kinase/response regulator transcription factor [Rhodohalobacter sp. 614A]|uniref:hybrid sensor histidine kinase/response regulator transcription factor n=1 Tax=Rhodohalobacter sp. 614A TaxID=2908649 RepID=UPI001F2D711A|nr:ATP-binding protein [Rhodohalobacter sp. 614A]
MHLPKTSLFHLPLKLIVSSFLILTATLTAQAQSRIYHPSFVIDRWGMEDGLPVNNALRIHQTQDGYLWFVTFDGLVRFDGLQFKVYQTEEYPDLPTNRFQNFQQAADSSLWLETEQEFLVRFSDGTFKHIGEEDGLNGSLCYQLSKGPDGNIWFGTDKGISVYDGKKLQPFEPEIIKGNIHRIFVQKNGAIWYMDRTTQDVYRYANGETKRMFTALVPFEFYPLYENNSGVMWIASDGDLYTFQNGKIQPCCSSNESNPDANLLQMQTNGKTIPYEEFDNGFFLFGGPIANHYKRGVGETYSLGESFFTSQGGEKWTFTRNKIFHEDELVLEIKDDINSYLFDHEGNLWVGTAMDGLYRIKPNPFTVYSTENGLPGNNVYPLMEDDNGTVWAGLFGPGVVHINSGAISELYDFENENVVAIRSLLQQDDGKILAGVINNGYFELNPGAHQFKKVLEPESLMNATVHAIWKDKNEDLWLGSNIGLFRKKNDQWKIFNSTNGFTDFAARFFLNAPDGSVWIATNGGGIANYSDENFDLYSSNSGLKSDLIRSLFIEPGSNPENYVLWIGTEDIGLIRLEIKDSQPDFTTITHYDRSDGLLDYVIHIVLMDDDGNFWFNTNRGIFTVSKEQLEAFHQGEIKSINGVSYTESDGLRNREGNGGVQSPGIFASDGQMWFPGQGGITVFNPSEIITNDLIPPIHIEQLQTPDQTFLSTEKSDINLEAAQRDFELEFTSLSYVEPQKNRFRYRLKGYNDTWVEAGSRRTVSYTNIPAGRYTFEVMGSNNVGVWNPDPATQTIVIDPFFYETIWFRALMILGIALLLYIGFRLRVRSLKQNELRLKQLVDERTEELQNEKQKTEEQAERLKEMDQAKTRFFTNISHEFRTPLTLIISPLKRLLSKDRQKFDEPTQHELDRMLRNSNRLLRLMNQTLELTHVEQGKLKVRAAKIDLNRFLGDLTELFQSICDEKGLELILEVPDKSLTVYADPDKLDKIAGNLLSNAIKFTPSGGRILVEVNELENDITIQVSDTGIGISETEQKQVFDRFYQVDSSETRYHEGSGIGLSLALEFAKLHQGDLTVSSVPGEGTTFTVRLKKGKNHFTEDQLKSGEKDYVIAPDFYDDHEVYQKKEHTEETADTDQTTILVVEDNDDVREFLIEELSGIYRVLEAANGVQALSIAEKYLPDLIIADIMMPELDGISFNRKLKENSATASIPVIFLTAKAAKKSQIEGLEVGADDYITKPFDPDLLKARVQNLIESRHRLRKLLQKEHPKNHSVEREKKSSDDPFLKKIDGVLAEQFSNPDFKVQDLADQLHMDRSQVLRKLKKKTDLSPGEYIKKYRMEKASELLLIEAGNITEVAYAVGYKSLSYFSYVFKEYYEMSPTEYVDQFETEKNS